MRGLFLTLALFLYGSLSAQTMLPAAEWCAAGKRFFSSAPPPNGGPDRRSDSIDIHRTRIFLDITDFPGQQIRGYAAVTFSPKIDGVPEIRLDLLDMTIDSVLWNGAAVAWTYNSRAVSVGFPTPIGKQDSGEVQVHYHGHPVQDASGWGGFYWQGNYAYNLGVGFAADPHNYGRAWFPCFDNFVERCGFEFFITTPAGKPSWCNGFLADENTLPDGKIERHWEIDQEIPSYLACVAVGPFTSFRREYTGEAGPIPVEIAVAPADSSKLSASFVHLPDAVAAFEYWYGPFRWNKIGYSIVPFNQGAMEHATNIAYMQSAVNGTTANETLMAHELSHHWWGDMATCSTAEDMWLNEGWAVYSEHLFLEHVYGPGRFHDAVETNFLRVLEQTHVNEGGYRAVSGVPHDLTYGEHVYNKGAAVAHNLRGYLGDSLFRVGLRAALDANQFSDWSSAGLRDHLTTATGYDLSSFFDDWVYSPGFTHFSIDSFRVEAGPIDTFYHVTVFVKQKLRGAPHYYRDVPIEISFLDATWRREYRTALVSGITTAVEFDFPLSYLPVQVWANTRQRLTLARAEKEQVVKAAANFSFSPAKMNIRVNTLQGDSALLRVEHHYAMPDTAGQANPHGYRLSNRYWSVYILQSSGSLDGDLTVYYDGRGQLDQLDAQLFTQIGPLEDSILLVYRPGPGQPWQEYAQTVKSTLGSSQDRYGLLRGLHILPGQYAIAQGAITVNSANPSPAHFAATVSPNPGAGIIRINAEAPFDHILVYRADGVLLLNQNQNETTEMTLSTVDWPAGIYRIQLFGKNGTAALAFQKIR